MRKAKIVTETIEKKRTFLVDDHICEVITHHPTLHVAFLNFIKSAFLAGFNARDQIASSDYVANVVEQSANLVQKSKDFWIEVEQIEKLAAEKPGNYSEILEKIEKTMEFKTGGCAFACMAKVKLRHLQKEVKSNLLDDLVEMKKTIEAPSDM